MNETSVLGEVTDSVKSNATMLLVLGIVTSIMGVLAMMSPWYAGGVVATMIAIFLIAAGIARTIFAFKAGSFGKGLLAFVLGALTIVVGIWIKRRLGTVSGCIAVVVHPKFLAAYGEIRDIALDYQGPIPVISLLGRVYRDLSAVNGRTIKTD